LVFVLTGNVSDKLFDIEPFDDTFCDSLGNFVLPFETFESVESVVASRRTENLT
jgi:hypothetical protein